MRYCEYDLFTNITGNRFGDPMRAACAKLSVANIPSGHWAPLEHKAETIIAVRDWLKANGLAARADADALHGGVYLKAMVQKYEGINPTVPPSGTGCVECLAADSWWFHLRRCAECGHIGCCDQSPGQHATKHFHASGHPVIASFEPDEHWFYNYKTQATEDGPHLAPPQAHPTSQPTPGPAGRVPDDWQSQLNP